MKITTNKISRSKRIVPKNGNTKHGIYRRMTYINTFANIEYFEFNLHTSILIIVLILCNYFVEFMNFTNNFKIIVLFLYFLYYKMKKYLSL